MNTKSDNFWFAIILLFITVLLACNSKLETTKSILPDTPAVYEGENDMGWVIAHYMIYPKSESKENRAGIVEVSWTVNKLGEVENVKAGIRKSDEPAQTAIARKLIKDKEVLGINQPVIDNLVYAIKLLKFIPAKKNGISINSELSTSVEFILIE